MLQLLAVLALQAAPPPTPFEPPPRPVSTFSVVARDPDTGALGVAVQSHWFSVGSVVPWAEPGVGAVATQSFARIAYGPELLADLAAGLSPQEALEKRTGADPGRDVRQLGVVDASGRAAAWTGERCVAAAGHVVGPGFTVQGNMLADDGVVEAMAVTYADLATDEDVDFAERLLRTLEAAQLAGGDARGRQSAAILIVSGEPSAEPGGGVLLELRVEDHPHPIEELRRLVRIHRAYRGDPAAAVELAASGNVELDFWRAVQLLSGEPGEDREAGLALLGRVLQRDPQWFRMLPRLMEKGHLPDDPTLLAAAEELLPAFDLRRAVRDADADRIRADVERLVGFGTRHTLSDTESDTRGIGAARRWLRDEFTRISDEYHDGRLQVELVAHQVPPGRRVPDGAEVVNVVATLPGDDPDRFVVVSGHYDSIDGDVMDAEGDAPGADDDASGTAAVLEAARLLGGLQPRATLVFMAVAGEEQGLLGARAQAEQWQAEGKEIVAMITMDIVGGARGSDGVQEPWRLRVFSSGVQPNGPKTVGSENDAPARQLARYLRRAGEAAVPGFEITLVFRRDRYLRGGDHIPFDELGWPAVRLTEPHENYDHQHQFVRVEDGVQYGDLPEFVDFDFVARVASTAAATVGELAAAPPSPGRVRMDVSRLTPHTRLLWNAVPGATGYAVLYRRTDEPDWTHRRVVGEATEALMEGLSKDDWLFAVEAYDEAGHRSLPVYPAPDFGDRRRR